MQGHLGFQSGLGETHPRPRLACGSGFVFILALCGMIRLVYPVRRRGGRFPQAV